MTSAIDAEHRCRPVVTWASDWAQTTTPVATQIVPCPACGCLRYAGDGPHAPRWLDGRRVDCVGLEVRP